MWIIIASLLILGCLIYMSVTLLGYTGHASTLSARLKDLELIILHKSERLEDYRIRAEQFQGSVPILKQKTNLLTQWIGALKKQKAQIGKNPRPDGATAKERDAAVRRGMTAVTKRKS